MKIGYARVSTTEQNESLQITALKSAGCERIYSDKGTGSKFDRVGLNDALSFMREGDTLVVWKIDRLGRSLIELIKTVNGFREQGIGFISLTEHIDTTTPGGMLIFHIFGSLAEFERELIRERTRAGLTEARARGKIGGRPRKLPTESNVALALSMYADKSNEIDDICKVLKISRTTLYRYIRESKKESNG